MTQNWTVAALYEFADVGEPAALAAVLRDACAAEAACGTLIVAPEGINGTIATPTRVQMDRVLDVIGRQFKALELKFSQAAAKPFGRMKVKMKPEIVTMRTANVNPQKLVGTYVAAEDWNALIAQDDVLVVDTRNSFEVAEGTFEGAIDPGTVNFCDFPAYVAQNLDPAKHKKIAMFCTGGIRCEKASSYMRAQGFPEVYHLKGGILKYLETVPENESRWRGRCFVFDERRTLGHGLQE